jgi:CRP-like cAMP-binding protein
MSLKLPSRTGNRLLDRLSEEEYDRLRQQCEIVSLGRQDEVYRQYGPLSHVYFPVTGVISTVILTEEGERIEAATVGNEGMVGVAAVLGLDFSPVAATSQVPGQSLRLPVPNLLRAAKPGGDFDRLLRRYAAFKLRYVNQTVACNALHSVEQRMCRWLLMARDRVGRHEFPLTHEILAQMLGVRRPTISLIARALQSAGLLAYRRGIMRVESGKGLEAASCECYEVTKNLYNGIVR